ncbi:FeS assembly SUF system protein [Bacillus sp. V3-13]|uniref:metal-sulfur cluster assembly factor n=1 Tax=Bacillus sp. V3-13 TaxID=2053728 RepID=UPI000C75FB9C|nr:metal-sulfur cluster assembly factor [Bacillus sp. V3-13]PLR77190.1 FeS assembly SUF system protein [Bacillus sp. V3-13]
MDLTEYVRNHLKRVLDPELNINVVDLGLIYDISFPAEKQVKVTMTLTTPGCPLHDSIANGVKYCLEDLEEFDLADVKVVWEPAWSPEKMSPEGMKALGR